MKIPVLLSLCFCAAVASAQTNTPPETVKEEASSGLTFLYGADLRLRQELYDNIPGDPADPFGLYQAPSGKNANYFRYRPRIWGGLGNETFKLYTRLTDEMREYVVKNGKRRDDRSYNFPDELIVDNLYFEGMGLFDGFLDFRIGRQDFFDNGRPAFGAGRVLMDGTPYDGSRTLFFDAARFTLHPTAKSSLDAIAIYDNSRNELHWGRPTPDPRPTNAIDPRDQPDMDQMGGVLYYKNAEFQALPFEAYYVYQHSQDYNTAGRHMPSRSDNTFGIRLLPQFTEELEGEFEGAAQAGKKGNNAATRGYMAFAGLKYKPDWELVKPAKPFFRAACYYLSGDADRSVDGNDTAWNPVWGRWPQLSEMHCYGPLYGLGYWSNLTYPHLGAGANIGLHHKIDAYSGPMFASVQDGLGGGDSNYEGWLTCLRYDFPIWKNPRGNGRGDIFGHIMGECLQPGDYYVTDKTAYFFRWEINFVF